MAVASTRPNAARWLLKVVLGTIVFLAHAAFWGAIAMAVVDRENLAAKTHSGGDWTGIFFVLITGFLGMPWNVLLHDVFAEFASPFVSGIIINYLILLMLSITAFRWIFRSSKNDV